MTDLLKWPAKLTYIFGVQMFLWPDARQHQQMGGVDRPGTYDNLSVSASKHFHTMAIVCNAISSLLPVQMDLKFNRICQSVIKIPPRNAE